MTLLDVERARGTKGKRGRWKTGYRGTQGKKGKKRKKGRGCEKKEQEREKKIEVQVC